jgi:hypothetical protein
MHILKDGTIKQPSRKWYTMRETLKIYADGGHVVLKLAEPTALQKQRATKKVAIKHD